MTNDSHLPSFDEFLKKVGDNESVKAVPCQVSHRPLSRAFPNPSLGSSASSLTECETVEAWCNLGIKPSTVILQHPTKPETSLRACSAQSPPVTYHNRLCEQIRISAELDEVIVENTGRRPVLHAGNNDFRDSLNLSSVDEQRAGLRQPITARPVIRDSANISPRKRCSHACTQCQRRKTKCDLSSPRCSPCQKNGYDCVRGTM